MPIEKCKRIDKLPHLIPGWGCCQCHHYNGYQRVACRFCGHSFCYDFKPGELLPVAGSVQFFDPAKKALV